MVTAVPVATLRPMATQTVQTARTRVNGATAAPAAPPVDRRGLSDERLRDLYRTMLRIRRFEERVKELFLEASLYGSVHLYIGEEAVATGGGGRPPTGGR